jgi:hypothetical protein
MPQKQVVQIPVNNNAGIIVEPCVVSEPNHFYGYEIAIEKEKRNNKIELRLWMKRLFNIVSFMITVFSRLLKWFNGIGSNEINLRRMERRSDWPLGMRKWNL